MQSDWKEIYKKTAERTGGSEKTYKDIGNFIFARLQKELKRPKSLIIKLRGVGSWHLRRKRMQIVIEHFPPNFDKKPEEFSSPLQLLKHENKIEIFKIFKERLKDYEQYVNDRDEIRKIRYGNQTLLESPDKED